MTRTCYYYHHKKEVVAILTVMNMPLLLWKMTWYQLFKKKRSLRSTTRDCTEHCEETMQHLEQRCRIKSGWTIQAPTNQPYVVQHKQFTPDSFLHCIFSVIILIEKSVASDQINWILYASTKKGPWPSFHIPVGLLPRQVGKGCILHRKRNDKESFIIV